MFGFVRCDFSARFVLNTVGVTKVVFCCRVVVVVIVDVVVTDCVQLLQIAVCMHNF